MCEKPISVELIATEEVIAKAASKPDLKFLVPFSRRCESAAVSINESDTDG